MRDSQSPPVSHQELLERRLDELVELKHGASDTADGALVRSIIRTALRIGDDGIGRAEAKILARSVRELAASFSVFAPYRDRHLKKILKDCYNIPGFLPVGDCFYYDRYFPEHR